MSTKVGNLRQGKQHGAAVDADLDDANDDDDDDDSDDEEDQNLVAEKESEDDAAEKALKAALQKKQAADAKFDHFKDDRAFDMKINVEVVQMTNETQSPTLSSFLGALRAEMRMYNKPSYTKYLATKVVAAEARVAELQKQLGKDDDQKKAASVKAPAPKAPVQKEPEGETIDQMKPVKVSKDGAVQMVSMAEGEESSGEKGAAMTPEEVGKKASETWALSFFADVALMAVVFGMANAGNTVVKGYTWFLIDQVIAIFLAVMYFQAFDSLLDFGSLGTHDHVTSSILHALLMLGMVMFLAYVLRKSDLGLAVLCGAGAHVVSFSSIHAAASMQNKVWLSYSYHWVMCIFGMLVLGLGLATIGYLVYTAKKRADLLENDSFMDKTDDLENDFGAMAFSVLFSMFMRFLLTGHHPADDETEFDHTKEQRLSMFIYACACMVVAVFVTSACSKKGAETNSYPVKRVMNFITTVAAMNVAWAVLYWGEWEFFETMYPGEAIKGRVMFGIVTTILGCAALIGLATIGNGESKAKMVALTALSLVIAWSWELCFDAAVEDMTEGVAHPVGWKIATTLCLFSIVVPVYAYYVKPACIRNNEAGG